MLDQALSRFYTQHATMYSGVGYWYVLCARHGWEELWDVVV